MADLFLLQAGGSNLFLQGTAALNFEAHFPDGGGLARVVPPTIPAPFLQAMAGGFDLQPGTTGARLNSASNLHGSSHFPIWDAETNPD